VIPRQWWKLLPIQTEEKVKRNQLRYANHVLLPAVLIARVCIAPFPVFADPALTVSSPSALALAVEKGGYVMVAFDGVVHLDHTLMITTNVTLDATGHRVSLDGGNATRHCIITNGATLRLINVTLFNGRTLGGTGQTNQPGIPAFGGSILNSVGNLELVGCTFLHNQAIGGDGGPPASGNDYGNGGGAAFGGAIYATNGVVAITNCSFVDNFCLGGRGSVTELGYSTKGGDSLGGALCSTNCNLTLIGVSFTNNTARSGDMTYPVVGVALGGGDAYGGAVADGGGTTLASNCVFIGNQALGATRVVSSGGTGSGKGGAIFHNSGTMNADGTFFSTNMALGGPGIDRGVVWVFGDGAGGAVFNGGRLECRNSAFVANQAKGGTVPVCECMWANGGDASGGGIYSGGSLSLINCTLADNNAIGGDGGEPAPGYGTVGAGGSGYGGAVFSGDSGGVFLVNVTVVSNSVQVGASTGYFSPVALGASVLAETNKVFLTNTILHCAASQTNVSGTILDGGHNICSDASANFTSSTSRNSLDPLLGTLGYYGGPTPTVPLLAASPAIDAGDDSASPAADQRGVRRPQGAAFDIGAFELAPTLKLTPSDSGKVRVDYLFQANRTNLFSATPDLLHWTTLGTRVSDTNGVSELEEVDTSQSSGRFYKAQPAP
jgi:hypothetical protein